MVDIYTDRQVRQIGRQTHKAHITRRCRKKTGWEAGARRQTWAFALEDVQSQLLRILIPEISFSRIPTSTLLLDLKLSDLLTQAKMT